MIIDLVVGAVIAISAIISFFRGLIRETLTIAGVAGGGFAAVFFGPSLAPIFRNWLGVVEGEPVQKLFDLVPMTIIANLCAYAVIFIAVVIVISLISHFVSGAVKAMGLGPVDRTLGVVFGIVRAVFLLGLLYLPFHLLMAQDSKDQWFGESRTHIYIEKTATLIASFLPSSKEVTDTADDVVSGEIKKKLFENDILHDKNASSIIVEETEELDSGYDQKKRDQLNDLIREPVYNE